MRVNEEELKAKAKEMRKDILRMIAQAGSGHPGGSLSSIDCLCALYFGGILKHNPQDPQDESRDRFILSKGHAAPALYTTLAHAGYFPREELLTLRQLGSRLQGHPDSKKLPGIEVSTGSLGQGLSVACGIAAGFKLSNQKARVFCLLGDGECQEGQIWEAAMFAAHRHLDNLIAIVDHNHLQIDGAIEDVCSPESLEAKFVAFGWDVQLCNGNDMSAVLVALSKARSANEGRPQMILAETLKGKGVSFMEGQSSWHGKAPSDEELERALAELNIKES